MPRRAAKDTEISINSVIRPVMQLRAGLDRISTLILRDTMGFGVSQFRILYVLAYKPDITQKDIASFWDVTEASVSRQVSILVRRGYVTRSPKSVISATGKKALDKAMKYLNDHYEKLFEDFSTKDRKIAIDILEKLLEKVKTSTISQ